MQWKRIVKTGKDILALCGLISIIVDGIFYFCIVQPNNQKMEDLLVIQNTQNANITELTRKQTELESEIYNLTNYEPTISIQAIQPIKIGPTYPITKLADGRVSFEYSGILYLNLTVLVATAHSSILTIIGDSLQLHSYNSSQYQIGFFCSGITANNYTHPFTAGSAEILQISMPFTIYYGFSESHILEYVTSGIASLYFTIQFYDFQTTTIKLSNTRATSFVWDNQTSTP